MIFKSCRQASPSSRFFTKKKHLPTSNRKIIKKRNLWKWVLTFWSFRVRSEELLGLGSTCACVCASGCVSVRVSVCVRMSEREDEKIKKKVKCLENFFSCQSSCLNYMTRTKRGNNWLERKKTDSGKFSRRRRCQAKTKALANQHQISLRQKSPNLAGPSNTPCPYGGTVNFISRGIIDTKHLL